MTVKEKRKKTEKKKITIIRTELMWHTNLVYIVKKNQKKKTIKTWHAEADKIQLCVSFNIWTTLNGYLFWMFFIQKYKIRNNTNISTIRSSVHNNNERILAMCSIYVMIMKHQRNQRKISKLSMRTRFLTYICISIENCIILL